MVGVGFALLNMALDVLDHYDGIVYHQPCRQRDAEQSQRVDRKIQQLDEGECADQRNRNRDRWNDGAAPVLKKDEDHQNHEDDSFHQRDQHVLDRFSDCLGGVKGVLVDHPRREALGQPVQFGENLPVNIDGIGGRELGDADADRVDARYKPGQSYSPRPRVRRGQHLSTAPGCHRHWSSG